MRQKKTVTAAMALDRLETLCARSEQCSGDLARKLYAWGISSDDSAKILARLKADKFVDDQRFARAYVRDKLRFSRWGRVKIRLGLAAKRVNREMAAIAIDEEIDKTEYHEILIAVLKSRLRTIPDPQSYDGKTRLFRYGLSRGFESAEVSSAIRSGELWGQE